jgi:hypothetical protein
MSTEESRTLLFNKLMQPLAGQRPAFHDALVVAVIDNIPTLGAPLHAADRLAQLGVQPPAAPQKIAQNRMKSQWWKRFHGRIKGIVAKINARFSVV